MDDGVRVGSPAPGESGAGGAPSGEPPSGGPLTFSSSGIAPNSALTAGDGSGSTAAADADEGTRVSAYARLDFESFTFYVQTLQVFLGRRAQNGQNMVDVHLGGAKAISRRHAKIFYNFATQRFEFTVMGRNGAFVGGVFVENGSTVPLKDNTRIQIGQINFKFVLPSLPKEEADAEADQAADATELHDHASTDSNEDETNFFATKRRRGASSANSSSAPPVPRAKKREYLPEEIPIQYREKPQLSYSALITRALQDRAGEHGLSLADIYEAIMEIFPFYRYCPSGWQNSVRHNLSSSKAFRKVSKEGKGWLWGLDHDYISEKEQKRAASKQRRASNDKSIAELAQEIPARRQSESKPRTESGNLLSPALIRLLARLQTQLQGHLAKAGGKSINPNILSNALANVVARAAKSSGGIEQLEKLLQSPQQVNLILVQALEFVKFQRRRASDAEAGTTPGATTPGPTTPGPITPGPITPGPIGTTPGPTTPGPTTPGPTTPGPTETKEALPPGAPISSATSTSQPSNQTVQGVQTGTVGLSAGPVPGSSEPSTVPAPVATAPQPQIPAQAYPPVQQLHPPAQTVEAAPSTVGTKSLPEVEKQTPAPAATTQQPVAAPTQPQSAQPAQAPVQTQQPKPKYTPEQISRLIEQAEKVQNPSPAIIAAIEQLRAHQRAMLKRPVDGPEPPLKRPTTINEA